MDYSLNIDLNKYTEISNNNNDMINFTFLDSIKDNLYKYDNLYKLLNNDEEFKIKNIYNYIYNRILQLNKIYGIDKLDKIYIRTKLTYVDFNDMLLDYINNDLVKSIIIINSIQQYYNPLRNI
jgi:hypothetical protein